MVNIDLSDYVASGYFITKYGDGSRYNRWMGLELLPPKILSLSSCVANFPPVIPWAFSSSEDYSVFGVSTENDAELSRWADEHSEEIGYPYVFYQLDTARKYIQRFVTHVEDLVLLGSAIHRSRVEEFLIEQKAPPQMGEYGVYNAISRGSLPETGKFLGLEIVSYRFGIEHSWHCNMIDKEGWEKFQIMPNAFGLIDSTEDADELVNYVIKSPPEPGMWLPLVMIQYSFD